jgi:hypothetical protein
MVVIQKLTDPDDDDVDNDVMMTMIANIMSMG